MKLKRYLTESKNMPRHDIEGIQEYIAPGWEIIKVLEKDCKPFISKMGKSRLLLRGSRVSNLDGIIKLSPRSDRKPMSTSSKNQEILDKFFKAKFGWKPRSTGLFCTTVFNTAIFYGQPNSIWPIGPFKFLWSKAITDMFTRVSNIDIKYLADPDTTKLNIELKKAVDQYTDKNLSKALNSDSEIMIGCKSYYMVSNDFKADLQRHFKVGFLG